MQLLLILLFLGSANSSVSDGPISPSVNTENLFDNEHESSDVESLKHLLQEVCWFCSKC